ncbi:50S ribosomal protein L32 [Candidatus Clavichlamydia salmonicola]|uniref:50S ribosomal protein L32 n=1 Tax=Candidatus Clavichlamydia salmonicola TaxID=469812 RepID=UPI001891DD71|nr:50S ribosomal protein L32 [Candidatus Clavichlamydia salmonicola]MBF5050461.1 50S ribosomal protein L32 [Candidatus Clavichlamydia salmonicola]
MAVPRNRLSNARKNIRRSHHAKKPKDLLVCDNCAGPRRSHCVCSTCGFYKGKLVVSAKA